MAEVNLSGITKSFGAVARHQGRRPRHRDRRVRRLRRPVGLRQVDAAAPDRRAGGHHQRHDEDRRRGGERRAALEARHRDGVPVLRALPAHDRLQQHGLRHEARARQQGGDRQAGARGGRHPAARPLSRPPAEGAFRRPAPARRDRPRHRAQPEGLPLRRAAVEPRRGAPRRRRASRSPSCTRTWPARR